MARISTYNIDQKVVAEDKWIGTDSNGSITKNFKAQSIADFLNDTSAIAIAGQNNFFFQTDLSNGRSDGTISFTNGGGVNTAFSDLTTIKISRYASSGTIVIDYLLTLVGKNIFIAQTDDANAFGSYTLVSLEQDLLEPLFYNAELIADESNGSLKANKFYALAIYPGGVQTAPNLQEVTNAGNTTTNEIKAVASGLFETIIGPNYAYTSNIGTTEFAGFSYDGYTSRLLIGSNSFETAIRLKAISLSAFEFVLPNDKIGGVYTLATTDDITGGTLQEVTDAGNTTTNSISIIGNGLNIYGSVPIGGFTYNNQTGSVNAYFIATPTNPLIDLYRQNDFGSYGVFLQTNNSTYAAFTTLYDSNLNLEWSESGIGGSVNLTAGDSVSNGGKITFYDNDNFGSIRVNDITANVVLEFPNKAAGTYTIATTDDIPTAVTSVGLSMPSAFTVSNSPITGAGVIAVSGAGTSSQYIRGDGQLAAMPSGGGGGSSVNYYLNGSIAASVATYKQLSNTAIIGGGTDFTLTGNGLITQFLTDVGNPNRIEIPGGAWNFEMWFSMSSNGGTPKFYVELLKYNGTTFTTIANSSAVPETITGGTTIDLYLTSLAVPTTTLLSTDRLAIRVYIVNNSGGRTATLHTEDNHLCEILTTFSSGVTSLNGLTANTQYLATGTTGTDFNISSITDTHTFNLPDASATARGLVTINGQTLAGAKTFSTAPILSSLTASQLLALDASKNIQSLNGTGLVKLTAGAISYDVNNYVKAIVKDAVQKTVTGAVGTIIISGYLIPANTFVAGDALKIDPSMFTRSGTSSMVISIYINSSLSLIGAARLAQSNTISATQAFTLFTRHYALDGTNLKGFPNILATSEIGANSNPMLSTPYDLTQDKYIIFTITPVNSADIAIQQYVNITN